MEKSAPFVSQRKEPGEACSIAELFKEEPGEHKVSAVQRERNARAEQLCCGALE